ncbi:hypothetical protein [uncultured Jatrophihabitans sp.]|uniref:hypothetical protein n=1 Tax=uncultured Jatrophihabitans sp. TaxID=1610747 RepID=UPI0035CBAE5B
MSPQPIWDSLFVYCPTCARESLAEAPPCADGHDDRCPDLVCLDCGTALFDAPIVEFVRPMPVSHLRPRHAA